MVDGISAFHNTNLPPDGGGRLPNINRGYNSYINSLLRNNGAAAFTLPEDTTDFSHNASQNHQSDGFWGGMKSLWQNAPGWIKWPVAAMAGLAGWRYSVFLPRWAKLLAGGAAAFAGFKLYNAEGAQAHGTTNGHGDTFGI